ncbi:unnamed protein product [Phytophthora fragariaefolia]|uniref:Unnamed protein product n=1 Tax=Phytophthora fragariaefolia TaxID=1490495 RepID=A0A9W6Y193_9STRA|nr:unnamed protein product [Phytophthora fragariaefolia]
MILDISSGESRGYWKYHVPDKKFKQAKAVGKINNAKATLLFDSGAEVSILDTAFARKITLAGSLVYFFDAWVGPPTGGQDLILGMDFMVPAGIRLDLANGTICLPDEVRIQLAGRRPLYGDKVEQVTMGGYYELDMGGSKQKSDCEQGHQIDRTQANSAWGYEDRDVAYWRSRTVPAWICLGGVTTLRGMAEPGLPGDHRRKRRDPEARRSARASCGAASIPNSHRDFESASNLSRGDGGRPADQGSGSWHRLPPQCPRAAPPVGRGKLHFDHNITSTRCHENASVASDTTLPRCDTERLIRSFAGISGGRPLAEALFEGLRDLHSAPRPANTAKASPVPAKQKHNQRLPLSQGDDQRNLQPPPLGSMNTGSRYDKELAEHTKALVSSPPIKLLKLHSKGDYKSWRSEVLLHFDTRMLDAITYGTERYDSTEGLSRAKFHEWFEARKNKAFSALALSLSVDLRTTFKIDDIQDNMDTAAMLFERITQHFEADDGIDSDYLLQELATRRLKSGKTATAYVDDVARKFTKDWRVNTATGSTIMIARVLRWQKQCSACVLPNINVNNSEARPGNKPHRLCVWPRSMPVKGKDKDNPASAAKHSASEPRMWQTKSRKQIAQTVVAMTTGISECTANTGILLRPDLADKDKAKKQRQKMTPSSLVSSVRQTEPSAGTRDQFAGLSLCGGQDNSDTSGAKPVYQDPPLSPLYSPTTPAESDDDDDLANANVPSTPQQLQLQPTVPERQVQQVHQVEHATPVEQQTPLAMQPAVPGAAQSQWEGATRSLGPPPSWESLFYYVGQGHMMDSQQRGLQEPSHANSSPQGLTPYERGKYEAQLQLQENEFDRGRSPPRMFDRSRSPPLSFGRGGSPPSMHGRGCSPPRNFGRGGSPPRMYGRSRSPPRNFGRGGSPQRGRGCSRSPPPPRGRRSQPRAGPPMRDQPSDYGPPPQQRYDGPPPGCEPSPRRDDYHRRNLSPRRREQLPRRFDDRGLRQVNAVAQRQDMQATDANTIEWILDSVSQANIVGTCKHLWVCIAADPK